MTTIGPVFLTGIKPCDIILHKVYWLIHCLLRVRVTLALSPWQVKSSGIRLRPDLDGKLNFHAPNLMQGLSATLERRLNQLSSAGFD
jgi:hypothetical protein